MGHYIIRVDSSVRTSQSDGRTIKVGQAAAAWTTSIKGHTIAAGVIYYNHNGPNRSVYEGIFAALSQLESEHFYAGGTDKITIYTDCEVVLNQLNGAPPTSMRKQKALITAFQARHPNIEFEFIHQDETNPEYQKVDQLSKRGRDWIRRQV
jgi:ribonuclease HI